MPEPPMSAERRNRLMQELADNGVTVYPSYATWLREALASDAIRAKAIEKLRDFIEEGVFDNVARLEILAATAEAE